MMSGVGVTRDSCNVETDEDMMRGNRDRRGGRFNFYNKDAYVDEIYRAL
jgi:hypothetical protein